MRVSFPDFVEQFMSDSSALASDGPISVESNRSEVLASRACVRVRSRFETALISWGRDRVILRPSILFLPDASERMRADLDGLGISTVSASQGEQAHEVDLVLIEPKQLGQDVAVLRRGLEETHPGVPVVVMGDAGLESAISAMRAGAADYVEPTTTALELASITRRLISERAIVSSLSGSTRSSGSELVGNSPKARELRERVMQLASSDVTVLISGETGSGKELVAN